jgi:hypothetical protein
VIRRAGAALLALGLAACGEPAGPGPGGVRLSLVPVFTSGAAFADNADQLRIRVQRDSAGTFRTIKDTTVAIDAEGNASADLNVVLLQNQQLFRILLDAIRSSDGMVLFSGIQEIQLSTASSEGQEVQVPVSYTGPAGTRLVLAPRDTSVLPGGTFQFRATVFDEGDTPLASPVSFFLVNPADAGRLAVSRLTGLASAGAGASGVVRVYGTTPNDLRDTVDVFLGAVVASVRIDPGLLALAVGGTEPLTAVALNQAGQPIGGAGVTWTSRDPGVATVTGGQVTGVTAGSTVLVAESGGVADSVRVAVAGSGAVLATVTANGRSFRAPRVGDTVTVEFGGDMRFASGDQLASYNVRFVFDPARLVFLDTLPAAAGSFPPSAVNADSVAQGVLRFAGLNPSGASGTFALLGARFRAVAAGAGGTTMTVREASGPAPSLTNLLSRVAAINGAVTVRP